jgi:hypothetical protein
MCTEPTLLCIPLSIYWSLPRQIRVKFLSSLVHRHRSGSEHDKRPVLVSARPTRDISRTKYTRIPGHFRKGRTHTPEECSVYGGGQRYVWALGTRLTFSYVSVGWVFLEQLALDVMDVGRLDVADVRTRTRGSITHAPSTPAMPSEPQRQVPGFTTGRLPHRDPHGSLRNARRFPQILCRAVGSRSYQRGMWASVTQCTSYSHTFLSFSKAMRKRRISICRRTGNIDNAVHELSMFYTDVDGWLELADIY